MQISETHERRLELAKERHLVPLLWGAAAIGFGLRVVLWWISQGSNDIATWEAFARTVEGWGLAGTYRYQPLFNHPPLMGWFSLLAIKIADNTALTFAQVFKLPSLLAELGTAWLIYLAWRSRAPISLPLHDIRPKKHPKRGEGIFRGDRERRLFAVRCSRCLICRSNQVDCCSRGDKLRAVASFAAYGVALNCILISGYHGNTDAMYFLLAFAAAYLMEARQAPFLSGLALGAAINVKIIPVLIALPLASRCTRLKDLMRFAFGASFGALPFLVAFLSFGPIARQSFVSNIFAYRSNREYWGVELVVRWFYRYTRESLPAAANAVREVGNWYAAAGGKLLLAASAGLAVWHAVQSSKTRGVAAATNATGLGATRLDAYQLCALGFALFLLFGSGFGVQYVGCVVPPLLAFTLWGGSLFALTSGIFIGVVYEHFVIRWSPLYSQHTVIPGSFSPLAVIAWLSLAAVCAKLLVDSAKRSSRPRAQAQP